MTSPTDSATCPMCGGEGEEREWLGIAFCTDPFHTPTDAPCTQSASEGQVTRTGHDAPTDEVREEIPEHIEAALCRVTFRNYDDPTEPTEEHDANLLRSFIATEIELRRSFQTMWQERCEAVAALSRDTEHDRLMREVVEGVVRESRRIVDGHVIGHEAGALFSASVRSGFAGLKKALGEYDRLTDYEGRSHE